MPWRHTEGDEMPTHSFLTSALAVGEWSTSDPCCFSPRKQPWYTLNKRLGGASDSLLLYFPHSLPFSMRLQLSTKFYADNRWYLEPISIHILFQTRLRDGRVSDLNGVVIADSCCCNVKTGKRTDEVLIIDLWFLQQITHYYWLMIY